MRLVLYFTKDVSLKVWDEIGILDRELAIYKKLIKLGVSISFITYGQSEDLKYKNKLNGINILCNKWHLNNKFYCKYIHLIHWRFLYNCDIIKTNQANGSEIAIRAANFWKKPLIGRMGYLWSEFVSKEQNNNIRISQIQDIENKLYDFSSKLIVTTDLMAKSIIKFQNKIKVVPNYVETNHFKPDDSIKKDFDILFIGRLSHQKNFINLLKVINSLDIKVLVIGDGELRNEMQVVHNNLNGRVKWITKVPNFDLPKYLNRSRIFILPSLYEGHPKVLIEAMSCGLAIIGSDVSGINNIINHNQNGRLCKLSVQSMINEIQLLLDNKDLRISLGKNAHKYAINKFSLDKVIDLEFSIYKEIVSNKKINEVLD